jgi:adenosine deaminase
MKTLVVTSLLLSATITANAQSAGEYLERIRDNSAALTAFFSAMPKGGDLHHHYSGSVYTETYINRVVANKFYIHDSSFIVVRDKPKDPGKHWKRFDQVSKDSLNYFKQQLVEKWSVKDYNGVSYPSDLQFFETFGYFGVTSNDSLKQGLQELKNRAIKENVSYIETMFTSIPCNVDTGAVAGYTQKLRNAQAARDEAAAQKLMGELYNWLLSQSIKTCARNYNDMLAKLHADAGMDDNQFTMRYQNYVSRTAQPLMVFKSLVTAFESTNSSPLLVGVNIVAPENNETSMADYWLHMQMYKFCHARYPSVVYSMHAGELVLGMVQPEELTWHIGEAVHTAGAKRIGHGVDIPYEAKSYDLMHYMAENKIAVEINLVSNEFILKVKNDRHPISLYKDFGVPIVISTDDAGVLRTNLIEQYVLLAKRYPEISYRDIKRFVYNSIDYSFIEEPAVKQKLRNDLRKRFREFEEEMGKVDHLE